MSDGSQVSPEETNKGPAAREKRQARKRVVLFVTVFVVCVLTLLTGYRYAIPTTANDYYLFLVARHTARLLDLIGHSGRLGDLDLIREEPGLVRARLRAWEQGHETPQTAPASEDPEPPLTFWEARKYRAGLARRAEGQRGDPGPLVSFVLRPGISTLVRETTRAIREVKGDPSLDDAARTVRLAELEAELKQLQAELDEARAENAPPAVIRGMRFPFTVVPECGAIPSMSIFISAVLAFPTRWWKRLTGVAAGIPILYGVNCLRLACLAVIGAWDYGTGQGGKWFNFAHHYVWQGVYIVFVVAVWMMWVEFVVRGRNQWDNQPEPEG